MRGVLTLARGLLLAPLIAAARLGPARDAVARDMRRFAQPRLDLPLPEELAFAATVRALRHPPLRSILYTRWETSGMAGKLLARKSKKAKTPPTPPPLAREDSGVRPAPQQFDQSIRRYGLTSVEREPGDERLLLGAWEVHHGAVDLDLERSE